MPDLYSYCIPYDEGAAPNPFWGVCTLAICKPGIRRNAEVGDWVVGTGTTQYDFQNKVVYAMEVMQVLSMKKYDDFCRNKLPQKIPNWGSDTYKERVGDCIYDYCSNPPLMRKGVHDEGNRIRDLSGENVLLSEHFYYFGDTPKMLPDHLLPIVRQGQGFKSKMNKKYFHDFVTWILTQRQAKNKIFSEPKERHLFTLDSDCRSKWAKRHREQDDLDEQSLCK
jgi:hypothetical protein